MRAGFSQQNVTPPVGTAMSGFSGRDKQDGCQGIHDDLFVRALWLSHDGREALIVGFDLLFFSRDVADRLKGAIGRRLDVAPHGILLNTSHTHSGPCVDSWAYGGHRPPNEVYLAALEAAVVKAACAARDSAREVTMWAGQTTTRLPVSRRKPDGKGGVEFRPWPSGTVCDCLPLCLFKDTDGAPVSLLYSVSCHPSTVGISEVSADYPGVATRLLNAQLGVREGALFLQGCGGDAKPVTIADGHDAAGALWRFGTWEDVDGAGRIVAEDAAPVLADGLKEVEPCLRTHAVTVGLPLESPKERQWYEKLAAHPEVWPGDQVLIRLWAERQVEMLRRGERQQAQVDIAVQGIQLGKGVRMIGLEGEAVGELGRQVLDFYGGGVTFPLGYIDATLIYLPTTAQIPEGGYEVDSYYEYGFPTPLAEALDSRLGATLDELRDARIE